MVQIWSKHDPVMAHKLNTLQKGKDGAKKNVGTKMKQKTFDIVMLSNFASTYRFYYATLMEHPKLKFQCQLPNW